MKNSMILVFVINIFTTVSCDTDASFTKGLNAGQRYSNNDSETPSKPQALIYYSNAPADTENYRTQKSAILGSFDEAAKLAPLAAIRIRGSRKKFDADFGVFNESVKSDVSNIQGSLCKQSPNIPAGAIFFTNAGIIAGKIEFCSVGKQVSAIPLDKLQRLLTKYSNIKSNKVYEHSPLSHPDMLKIALEISREIFPFSKFEYSLVLKSHGSSSKLLTPKVAFDAGKITGELIASIYLPEPLKDNPNPLDENGLDKNGLDKNGLDKNGLDKNGLDKNGLDKNGLDKNGLDKNGLDKNGLDKNGLEKIGLSGETSVLQNEVPAGSSKKDVLVALQGDAADMFFNVVFFESCQSDLSSFYQEMAESDSKPNIGTMYTSDFAGLKYSTVNWSNAGQSSHTKSLFVWLKAELDGLAAKQAK